MTPSVPDICDDFIDEISVLDPQFHDFGGRGKFGGEIVTIRCFEDNSLVGQTVRQPGHGRVIVVDGGSGDGTVAVAEAQLDGARDAVGLEIGHTRISSAEESVR